MEEIPVIQIYLWGNLVGAMSWDDERGYADFQFDDRFRRSGLDIAPLMMPLARTRGVVSFPTNARTKCFSGLPGLIADALPDKFGSQLITEWFAQQGGQWEPWSLCLLPMWRASTNRLKFTFGN